MKSLRGASIKIGRHKNYFSMMKHTSLEMFNFLAEIDKDMEISYRNYLKKIELQTSLVNKMYFFLIDNRQAAKFYRSSGYYIHGISLSTNLNYSLYLKRERILEEFNKYLVEEKQIDAYKNYIRENF
ncbi:MAG: hypothetical protein PHI79_04605 [Sulfurovaceae bacterium]|nr:hypothetical protein [Sulfurovaceae bacterium]MDD5548865.1 hypothetical protein [Sulfurovaceae bacterium]